MLLRLKLMYSRAGKSGMSSSGTFSILFLRRCNLRKFGKFSQPVMTAIRFYAM